MKKTKIICTIGPATSSYSALVKLSRAGMNVARLNFSHGDFAFFDRVIANIKKARKKGCGIAILQDLQGPKIRVGNLAAPLQVKRGETLVIKEANAKAGEISIDYRGLYRHVKLSDPILINDGMVQLRVQRVDAGKKTIYCKITAGGEIQKRKGVNLPRTKLPVPALTARDKKNLAYGLKNNVDIIALSFVRKAKDVQDLNRIVRRIKHPPVVIAKIEKPEAMKEIDAIIDACDGVMVARGDLAVEAGYSPVPMIQKKLVKKANEKGKIAIVATQMLESMINIPFPQRAEITDIYNSVLDGADTVMLSAETSVGKYPFKTVKVMSDILKQAERDRAKSAPPPSIIKGCCTAENVLSYAAVMTASSLPDAVIAVSVDGFDDINFISDYRPAQQIAGVTGERALYYKMCILNGVEPVFSGGNAAKAVKKHFPRCKNIVAVDFHPGTIRLLKA